MRLRNITEVQDFKSAIEKARDRVILQSVDGDTINLKSALSQYVAIGRLIQERGNSLELFCDNKQDEQLFLEFFYHHPATLED